MGRSGSGRSATRLLTGGAGVAAGAYAGYVALSWLRFGHVSRGSEDEQDPLLDGFMPTCDVVERRHIRVYAPASVTLAAAREVDLSRPFLVRAIFKARELILGATPDDRSRPRGLVEDVQSLGWVLLAEVADRELVFGAVTKPWEANVTFRSIPPDAFATFAEGDYVKIVWTIRADPAGETQSIFRTETRAVATDAAARAKFRRYWSFLSPGIILIRWLMLGSVKGDAERVSSARGRTADPTAT